MIKQITVEEIKQKLDAGERFRLVDCRERDEYQYCRIEGSTLIPLSEFQSRALTELKSDEAIVIHCHHGGRSQRACEYLQSQGYQNLANAVGGIDQWSLKIDSKVPRY